MHVNDGRGGEVGEAERGGKRKAVTATMLATIPLGTPAVHLPFKGFGNRVLQSLVCGSPNPPRFNKRCMHVVYAQTKRGILSTVPWLSEEG